MKITATFTHVAWKRLEMKQGRLIYKCRQCGALDDSTGVPDVPLALVCITQGKRLPKEWGCLLMSIIDFHHCDEIRMGVTDLIGGRLDE